MNREIRFRAWHKELDDMTYSLKNEVDFWYKVTNYPEMYFIMQYTGLKDKNGKDIYDNDLVMPYPFDQDEQLYIVEYMNDEAKFTLIGILDGDNLDFDTDFEVKGNRYENTELLK